jgi:hypothetical protein
MNIQFSSDSFPVEIGVDDAYVEGQSARAEGYGTDDNPYAEDAKKGILEAIQKALKWAHGFAGRTTYPSPSPAFSPKAVFLMLLFFRTVE